MNTRTVLKRGAGGLLLLLLSLLLFLGAFYVWLGTGPGQRFLARRAEEFFERVFLGRLELEKALVRLDGTLALENARLLTPEGVEVAAWEELRTRIALRPLLKRQVRVEMLGLRSPFFLMERKGAQEPWTFARALEPRVKRARQADKASEPWRVSLHDASLSHGHFRYSPGGPQNALEVRDFALAIPEADGSTALPFEVHLAQVSFVLHSSRGERPVSLSARVALTPSEFRLTDLAVASLGIGLSGGATWPLGGDGPLRADVRARLHAGSLVDFGIRNPDEWLVSLTASGLLSKVSADLGWNGGRAGALDSHLEGDFSRLDKARYELEAGLRAVDLSALGLASSLPESALGLRIAVSGRDGLASRVNLRARMDESRVGDQTVRAAALEALYTPERVEVRELFLHAQELQAHARGSAVRQARGWLPEFSFRLQGNLPRAAAAQKSPPLAVNAQGNMAERRFDLNAHLSQSPRRFVEVAARGELAAAQDAVDVFHFRLGYPGTTWSSEEPFRVRFKPHPATDGLALRSGTQRLGLSGSWRSPHFEGALKVESLDLSKLPLAEFGVAAQARGVLSAEIKGQGTPAFPQGELHLRLVQGGARWDQGTKNVEGVALEAEALLGRQDFRLVAKGGLAQARMEVDANASRKLLFDFSLQERIEAKVRITNFDLAQTRGLVPAPGGASFGGVVSMDAQAKGPLAHLTADGHVALADGSFEKFQNLNLQSRFRLSDALAEVEARLWEKDREVVSLAATWAPAVSRVAWPAIPRSLSMLEAGQLGLKAEVTNFDLARLPVSNETMRRLNGVVSASVNVAGGVESPTGDVSFEARGLLPQGGGGVSLQASYANGELSAQGLSFANPKNALTLAARVPARLGLSAFREKRVVDAETPLKAELVASATDLSVFEPLIPGIRRLEGFLNGKVNVGGTLGNPQPMGQLALEQGAVGIRGFRTLSNVRMRSRFMSDSVALDELSVLSGGSATLKGWITGLTGPQKRFEGVFASNNFMMLPVRLPNATLSTLISFKGDMDEKALHSQIHLDEGRGLLVLLPSLTAQSAGTSLARNEDVVVTRGGVVISPRPSTEPKVEVAVGGNGAVSAVGVAEGAAAPRDEAVPAQARKVSVAIQAPRNIRVEGPAVQLEFGVEDFSLKTDDDGELVFDGRVQTIRGGRVELIGRTFQVQESGIRFANVPLRLGEIDVAAAVEVAPSGRALVSVAGTVEKPKIEMKASEDVAPKSTDEVAMALLTGEWPERGTAGFLSDRLARVRGENAEGGEKTSEEKGGGAGSAAASVGAGAVAGLVSQRLQNLISGKTHLQVSLNVANLTDEERREASVQVGRYLTPRLFVSYENRVVGVQEETNKNQINMDYRLGKRWTLEGYYGDANEGGVNIIWKRHF